VIVAPAPTMRMPARLAFGAVRLYQRVTAGRPSPCRYVPTCSSYALDAYEQHGFLRGSWLTTRRLCRCHPWGGHGWDPVPPPRSHRGDPAPAASSDHSPHRGQATGDPGPGPRGH